MEGVVCRFRPLRRRAAYRYAYTDHLWTYLIWAGFGASATVYQAIYLPGRKDASTPVSAAGPSGLSKPALGINTSPEGLQDEKLCCVKISAKHPDLEAFFKETRLLGLSRHPNVLRSVRSSCLARPNRKS